MNHSLSKSLGVLALAACATLGWSQAAYDPLCWPENGPGFSTDYGIIVLPEDSVGSDNPLFGVSVGVSGTDTYNKFCAPPNGFSFEASGRVGFTLGSLGSVQSDVDNYLRLNYGMPLMAGGATGFAMVVTQDPTSGALTKELFGGDGLRVAFSGKSGRYGIVEGEAGDYTVRLRFDNIGDSARLNWRVTNNSDDIQLVGLWFGQWVTFLDANFNFLDPAYVYAPGNKPLVTPERFQRQPNAATTPDTVPLPMPPYINFGINQENNYGLQIVNDPAWVNQTGNEGDGVTLTPPDEVVVANAYTAPGLLANTYQNNSPTMPDNIIDGDVPLSQFNVGYIQKWAPASTGPGAARDIVAIYKSTWSKSDFASPFAAVIDAPNVISADPSNPDRLTPNPFTFRVYLDNSLGYAGAGNEVTLTDVRVQVNLPPGFSAANDEDETTLVSTVARIDPRTISFVDFQVRVDEDVNPNGLQPYSVQISAPTGARKTLTGFFNVASTPRLNLPSRANLVASPWRFENSSWEAILGLQVDQDFQAFAYDPRQAEYVIQTSPQRGIGTWIISNDVRGVVTLGGNPQSPTPVTQDPSIGGTSLSVGLASGWNLIANPFQYAIPLGELTGVVAQNPGQVLTFRDLVNAGAISGALFFYDAESATPDYRIIGNDTDLLLPNRGYWLFVQTANDPGTGTALTLNYPFVNTPFVAQSKEGRPRPTQTAKDWSLQLVARNDAQVDSENYVGVAKDAKLAERARAYEPPYAPIKGAISLGMVGETKDGKAAKLAHALEAGPGKKRWTVSVFTRDAGPVTVTWPNLNQMPKNLQFRLVDEATKTTRNLRRISGYTFEGEARSTRTFVIEAEPGAPARPVIGAITATRSARSANAPFDIRYTLSAEATTTVRILSGGRAIATLSSAKLNRAGENSVVWNLRDAADRSVAPGAYTVEITAEGENGDRVRKLYPINVIR